MRAPLLAALLLCLPAARAASADVHVQLMDRSPAHRCIASGGVIVASAGDPQTADVRVAMSDAVSSYDLGLGPDRVWHIAAKTDGCWSAARDWTPALGDNVSIDLFAAGEVSGSFAGAPSGRPSRITGGMRAASGEGKAIEPLECSLVYPAWRCSVPADLPFDLRIDPAGFAPVHYWSVVVWPGQKNELEPQALIAGASLHGWVQDAKGRPLGHAKRYEAGQFVGDVV